MQCLITGGRGFAGTHLARFLSGQGLEVIPLDRECDLRDPVGVESFLRGTRPERIYHLAAISSSLEALADPAATYAVNFTGTFHLLEAWRKLAFDARFLFVSSSDVYGRPVPGTLPLAETSPLAPRTPYAASKAAAEMLAMQYHATWGLPIIRVRPFTHSGPGQTDRFVCSSFARQAVEVAAGRREAKIAVGNISLRRDFSDVRDIVRGYHAILERGEPGEVYNLCRGRAVSIEWILKYLMSGIPAEIVPDPSRMRNDEPPEIYGNFSKAKEAVGWSPEIPLERTLDEIMSSWRSKMGV